MDAQQLQHSADDARTRAISRQKQADDARVSAEGKRKNGDESGAAVDESKADGIEQEAKALQQQADSTAAQVQAAIARGHSLQNELDQLRKDFRKKEADLEKEIQRISGNPSLML